MRLARAHTGREKILKFEGGYHGYSDYGLMSTAPARPGNSMEPIPDSAGIPASVKDSVVVAPYNDADAVESLLKEHEGDRRGGLHGTHATGDSSIARFPGSDSAS